MLPICKDEIGLGLFNFGGEACVMQIGVLAHFQHVAQDRDAAPLWVRCAENGKRRGH